MNFHPELIPSPRWNLSLSHSDWLIDWLISPVFPTSFPSEELPCLIGTWTFKMKFPCCLVWFFFLKNIAPNSDLLPVLCADILNNRFCDSLEKLHLKCVVLKFIHRPFTKIHNIFSSLPLPSRCFCRVLSRLPPLSSRKCVPRHFQAGGAPSPGPGFVIALTALNL